MKLLQAHFGLQTAHFAQNGYEYLYGTVYNQINPESFVLWRCC